MERKRTGGIRQARLHGRDVWVADDNGGEGFGSEAEARERMEAMRGATDPGVGLTLRPLSRRYRTSDNC